ncbi:MAG: glycosyltransferase family 2 protein [Cyclobacteriaceae bacterium]|nr:glycosyltransferase family 2 protein [Cyclobacteriaceae bacterium]
MTDNVCVILVNYSGHRDTIECLESVLKSTHQNFQVVVVDNSEGDHSINEIYLWARGGRENSITTNFREHVLPLSTKPISCGLLSEDELGRSAGLIDEKILLIKSKKNRGFAGGNNIGLDYFLKVPDFNYAWLLNNDTVIKADTLNNFVLCAGKTSERTGIVGGKLFDYYNRSILQAVGGRYYKWFGKVREVGSGERDSGQWDNIQFKFDYVVGASMFVKRSFVQSIGRMNEDYFLYFEELDWAIRGKKMGWQMGFCSSAIVFHKLGASTGSNKKEVSEISDFYSIRNRLQIAKRYFPATFITLYPSFLLFIINRVKILKFGRISLLWKLILDPDQKYQKM